MKKFLHRTMAALLCCTTLLTSAAFTKTEAAAAANTDTIIHFITLNDNTDAILLESYDDEGNALFGMVDSGEDTDGEPNPTNGSTPSGRGYEKQVVDTMKAYGVTAENFVFYIGTHPHSDHIGSGDTIIDTFQPERVYLQPYKDAYISNKNNLWDNAKVYQDVIDAANRVGATLIQFFDTTAQVNPSTVNISNTITWVDPEPPVDPDPVEDPDPATESVPATESDPAAELDPGSVADDPVSTDTIDVATSESPAEVTPPEKPESVTVKLMNGTEEVASAQATEANDWTYAFTNIPKYETNAYGVSTEIVYTIACEEEALATYSYVPSFDQENLKLTCTYEATATPPTEEDPNALASNGSGYDVTGNAESDADTTPEITDNLLPTETQEEAQDILGTTDELPQVTPDEASIPDPTDPADELNPDTLPTTYELTQLHQAAVTATDTGEWGYTATPNITLGTATIHILNYSTTYMKYPENDANNFSLAVKVTSSSGHTALLMGDVNNYENTGDPTDNGYDESKLAATVGHVDVLKFGHHGYLGSSIKSNLLKFSPTYGILTGDFPHIQAETAEALDAVVMNGTKLYATSSYSKERMGSSGLDAININLNSMSTNIPTAKSVWGISATAGAARYDNGSLTKYTKTTFVTDFTTNKTYCFPTGSVRSCSPGWNQVDGNWYYMYADSSVSTGNTPGDGWIDLSGKWYYLEPSANGKMAIGWKQIGSDYYYFNSKGVMQTNQWVDGYYLNTNGVWVKGLVQPHWVKDTTGWRYVTQDGSYAKNKWIEIKTIWYYFDNNAYLKTGWFDIGSKRYYSSANGMYTGWHKISNIWYYFDKDDGYMHRGWLKENNKWYYLTSSGAMLTGWYKVSGKYYYSNSSGVMLTGWLKSGGKWYYLQASGAMKTGWLKVSDTWYYLNSSGTMLTGWQKIGGKTYLLASSGAMLTGWHKVSGKWYYMQSGGAMKTGWLKLNGTWYYLNSSGAMLTGWQKIGGKYYYFYSSGSMAANTNIGSYHVDSNGVWVA